MNVSETGLQTRPAMYWFDLRQQFGVPGVVLAAIGARAYVFWRWPSRGALLLARVSGESRCSRGRTTSATRTSSFYPRITWWHCVRAPASQRSSGCVAVARIGALPPSPGRFCLSYPVWRGYDTLPAVDRSWDNRAVALLDRVHHAATPRNPARSTASIRTGRCRMRSSISCASDRPAFPGSRPKSFRGWIARISPIAFGVSSRPISEIGREVLVGPGCLQEAPVARVPRPLPAEIRWWIASFDRFRVEPHTRSAILRPDREYPIDPAALASAWRRLTAGSERSRNLRQFTIVDRPGRCVARPRSIGGSAVSGAHDRRRPSTSTFGWNRGCRPTRFAGPVSATSFVEPQAPADARTRAQFRGPGRPARARVQFWASSPLSPAISWGCAR